MRPTAVLASALVRPALVLVLTWPGGGEGGRGALPGGNGGGEGGNGGYGGGGAEHEVGTEPLTPVRVVAQEQTVPPLPA